jgi:hypothetical protein
MTETRLSLKEQTRQRIAKALHEDTQKRRDRLLGMVAEVPMPSVETMADRLGVPKSLVISELNELRYRATDTGERDRLEEALRKMLEG